MLSQARHKEDSNVNHKKVTRVRGRVTSVITWEDVRVGDVLKIMDDEARRAATPRRVLYGAHS